MAKQLEALVGKRFSQMTYDEKIEELQKLRKSRRTPKATSKVVRSQKRTQKKTVDKLEALMDSMSPEARAAFMKGAKE